MEKFYGFEVVISKSWRIQGNCINEKLDAEIQKDQRQSLRELYWNHNHSSWRDWRSPDEERGRDEKRQDYLGGLRGDGGKSPVKATAA